jgi:hypothetical protein
MVISSLSVQAAWYQVEVIVFEHLRPDLDQELWFENPGLPSRIDTTELISEFADEPVSFNVNYPEPVPDPEVEIDPEELLVPYMMLSSTHHRLKNDYRILRLSAEYRPLLHLAWQQPGYDSSDVRAVHLEKTVETEDLNEDLPEELADIQIIDESYQPPEMIFDGNIRLRTTRYLHMEVDMAFFPQNLQQILAIQKQRSVNADNLKINPESDYIRLVETRRIKLNELHYFDHPLFGILVQVSRLITP